MASFLSHGLLGVRSTASLACVVAVIQRSFLAIDLAGFGGGAFRGEATGFP